MSRLGGTKALGIAVTIYARTTIPIHYNEYARFESPLEDFERTITNAGLDDRIRYLDHGDT